MLVLEKGIIYMQIYDYFKGEIIAGRIKAGDKLPSKRQLAKTYALGLTTVETAYAKLAEEGFIEPRQRQGYFVSAVGELYIAPTSRGVSKLPEEAVPFDFSYSGVSEEGFPYRIFRRLASQIMEGEDLLCQVDYQGYPRLRQRIAEYLERSRGVRCHADAIVISSRVEYLYQMLFRLVPGSYAIEDPGYPSLRKQLKTHGVDYLPIPLDEEGMSAKLLKNSRAKVAVVTPAHQFPRGLIMSMARRRQLLYDCGLDYLIEDDYDSEFKYSNRPVPALKSMDGEDRVIYLGSFSKSISPAFRVSYMVLPQALLQSYHQHYQSLVCPVSIVIQKMLARFLESGEFEKHLNRMRKLYAKKRALIQDMVASRRDLKITGADAGLHVVLEYPNSYEEQDIIDRAWAKGIRLYGVSSYGQASKNPALVLGFASLSLKDLEKAMSLLLTI